MIFKNLLKTLGLLSLVASSFAKMEEVSNDCTRIKSYLEGKKIFYSYIIQNCEVNNERKVIYLDIDNYNLNMEIFNNLLSYPTIEELKLRYVDYKQEYVDTIGKTSNIKKLNINGGKLNDNINYDSWKHIEDLEFYDVSNYQKFNFGAVNLKNLSLKSISLTDSDISIIGSMTNLEGLKFDEVNLKNLNLEPLNNLKKITSLVLDENKTNKILDFASTLNNLKNLTINSYGLKKIPDFVFNLKNLEHLDLSYNSISEIPDKIENLTNLKHLLMKSNSISDISEKLGNLNIETLSLGDNLLEKIPDFVYNFGNLKDLLIYGNNEIKSISEKIGNLKNLENLDVSSNKIENIPDTIGNLKQLKTLDLSYNIITKIPKVLGDLENLEVLDLSSNKIYSELPTSLNNLSKLRIIKLYRNIDIKGKTLTNDSLEYCHYNNNYSLCKPKDMKCFDGGDDSEYEDNLKLCDSSDYETCESDTCTDECEEIYNYLESQETDSYRELIKTCIINSKGKVKSITFRNSELKQNYIDQISKLKDLEELQITYVDLPENPKFNFKENEKLTSLTLEGSQFKKIPDSVYEIPNLKKLTFCSDITKIPDKLYNIKTLEYLDLKDNEITKISDKIENLVNLKQLILNWNKISTVPNKIGNLKNLESIDIENNNIETIPESLSNIKNLTYVNLGGNKISSIPDNFVNLKELKYLNLEDNKFTRIPNEFGELKNLEYLNMNNNELYCEIPESLNKLSKLKEIYLYNNINLKGKTLTNESLKVCNYEIKYDLCIPKEVECLKDDEGYNYYSFRPCDSEIYEGTSECDEIFSYLEGKSSGSYRNIVNACITNNKGKTRELDLILNEDDKYQNYINEIGKLTELDTLTLKYINYKDVKFDSLKNLNKLTTLNLYYYEENGTNEIPEAILSLTPLKNLTIHDVGISAIPDSISDLVNLQHLDLEDNKISKIPSSLGNLENLLYLNLAYNKIYSDLPQSLNNLTKLKEIYLFGNINIKGKIINNKDLEICSYDKQYNICIDKDISCSNDYYNDSIKYCTSDDIKETDDECEKIYAYLSEHKVENYYYKVRECEINENGKVVSIRIENPENPQNYIDNLGKLTELKSLVLENFNFKSGLNFDVLKNLTKLEVLEIDWYTDNALRSIPKSIFSLTNLKKLTIDNNKITSVSDALGNLKNLELLDLYSNRLTKFPAKLSELKNLNSLNLGYNKINDELPEYLNSFTNLEVIILYDNEDLRGKTLTNDNLTECIYGQEYSLCLAKEMDCIDSYIKFKPCESNNENPGDVPDDTKISTDHKCGKGKGRCPAGECCSKYGWCGKSEKHCSVEDGCQSEFGECKTSTSTPPPPSTISTNGKCGTKDGKCPAGECCSKHGWCGKSEKHCSVEDGCQSEFGECKTSTPPPSSTISTNGKCGTKDGKCPAGECCSKHGWCGRSENHCSVEAGCQSEFGECKAKNADKISINGRCGATDGKCPEGECCSKYGWCGTSSDHCNISNGCQSEFGECHNPSVKGKCGKGYGKCPSGQCCSKYGWCGKNEKYCGVGCQHEFGDCN